MVNSHDPHRPFCDPKKLLPGAAMPSKIYTAQDVTVPGFLPNLPEVKEEFATYLNSTRRLDDTFGKVMQALKESGFEDNTIVVFMSDNGIAFPFAKCNAWFHSSRTPLLIRWPNVIKAGSKDHTHFVSEVDLLPTFLEVNSINLPAKLDGRSLSPLLNGQTQEGRDRVFTQIDKKAGDGAVPMRAIQNAKFGYIYNAFSNGDKVTYKNNNEGLTMKAMEKAATTDEAIAARVELFRHRILEEFYDLEKDPDCLNNLIDNPEYKIEIESFKKQLKENMQSTNDPMLNAFLNMNDQGKVDQVISDTYGKTKEKKKTKK
jgi:N-sulfoglucosamine sulfohydrolase